jgi:hypothetical protein
VAAQGDGDGDQVMAGQEEPVAGEQTQKTKSSGSSTTSATGTTAAETQKTLPPWATELIKGQALNYGGAVDQYGNAIQDWQAAGFSPDQLAGFESQRQAAGGEYMKTPLDELLATSRGDYLYGGPGFNAAVEAAQRQITPQLTSMWGGAGRSDSGLSRVASTQALGDIFAGQYGQERGRQLQAQQLLPGMSLLPGQTLQDIGAKYQQLQQYGQNYPLETLFPQLFEAQRGVTGFADPFLGMTSSGQTSQDSRSKSKGLDMMTGTSTPSYFPGSPVAGAAGGALAGLQMGAMTGNPYLAGAGAIGGGLMGSGIFG